MQISKNRRPKSNIIKFCCLRRQVETHFATTSIRECLFSLAQMTAIAHHILVDLPTQFRAHSNTHRTTAYVAWYLRTRAHECVYFYFFHIHWRSHCVCTVFVWYVWVSVFPMTEQLKSNVFAQRSGIYPFLSNQPSIETTEVYRVFIYLFSFSLLLSHSLSLFFCSFFVCSFLSCVSCFGCGNDTVAATAAVVAVAASVVSYAMTANLDWKSVRVKLPPTHSRIRS